ncbi:MAG TPA: hypothetical protein VGR19_03590 [Allosphingosinicella sp.]|nr:hypothetical protein [Allosphingosinicella sp.]
MYGSNARRPGFLPACLVAGPAFVWTYALADLYLYLPRPIVVSGGDVLAVLLFCLPATIVGFLLALPPTGMGMLMMYKLGETLPAARLPLAWTLTGAGFGAGIAVTFGAWPHLPPTALALVAASALCARICRRQAHWE